MWHHSKGAVRALPALAILLLACLVGAANTAAGQDESDREQARVLYERASERFQEGRFETAVTLLREAIALHSAAPLHYNLARALEELDDRVGAREAYEAFLELAPDHPERPAVEARIAELRLAEVEAAQAERRAAEQARAEAEARAIEQERASAAPTAASAALDPGPYVVLATAAVPLALGITFGVLFEGSLGAALDAESQRDAGPHVADAELFGNIATASFALAGALGLTGLLWAIIDATSGPSEDEPTTQLRVDIGPSGMAVRGAF